MANKSRMISIRLSLEEYREIKARCKGAAGDGNVSEFARSAMLSVLGIVNPESVSPQEESVAKLQHRIETLERTLEAVMMHLGLDGAASRQAGQF